MTQATLMPEPEVAPDAIADLGALQQQLTAEREEAERAYHAAVVSTARGKTPDDLRSILSAAGVTADDFQAIVVKLVARLAAKRQQTEAEQLASRVDAAQRKAASARETVDVAKAEFEERIRGLREAAAAAAGEFERLAAYRRSLLDQSDATLHRTASSTIADRLDELDAQRSELVGERNRVTDGQYAAFDAKIKSIDAEVAQLRLDQLDPVAGLCLGQRELTPAERTSKMWDRMRGMFRAKSADICGHVVNE
jgi:hypothetical protein